MDATAPHPALDPAIAWPTLGMWVRWEGERLDLVSLAPARDAKADQVLLPCSPELLLKLGKISLGGSRAGLYAVRLTEDGADHRLVLCQRGLEGAVRISEAFSSATPTVFQFCCDPGSTRDAKCGSSPTRTLTTTGRRGQKERRGDWPRSPLRPTAGRALPPTRAPWPAAKHGYVFDGGVLARADLAAIRLDPTEHTEWAARPLSEWERVLPTRAYDRLRAVEEAARTGTTAYIEHTRDDAGTEGTSP